MELTPSGRWKKLGQKILQIGGRVLFVIGIAYTVIEAVATVITEGPDAALRKVFCVDLIEEGAGKVGDEVRASLRRSTSAVDKAYKRRAGLDESDDEYGLWSEDTT